MSKPTTKSTQVVLPEPSNAFARWIAVVVTSSWALGVQSFPDPYNKLTSVLAPGVGYLAGHTLQYGIFSTKNIVDWISRKRSMSNVNFSIASLNKELEYAKKNGLNQATITLIEELLEQAYTKRLRLIAYAIQS